MPHMRCCRLLVTGIDASWPQFPGLKELLESYVDRVAQKHARADGEIVNLGSVDNAERAQAAGRQVRRVGICSGHYDIRFDKTLTAWCWDRCLKRKSTPASCRSYVKFQSD